MRPVSDQLYAKASAHKTPLAGTFELSPVCNFRCRMCYVRRTPAQIRAAGSRLIPWQEWLALADRCTASGMLYLLLTGGEPFAYPHFRELYEALHDRHILLSINTNGSLIDREAVDWLKKRSPHRVNVTLYGASPETYARLCGDPTGYERTTWAIRALREAGIPVVINASMTPENAGDMEAIAAFGKSLDVPCRFNTYMFPPVRREREATDSRFTPEEAAAMYLRRMRCTLDEAQYTAQLDRMADSVRVREEQERASAAGQDAEAGWGSPAADSGDSVDTAEHMTCRAGRCSFWVSWEGKMTACGMVPFPLVTYPFERPFAECWAELTNTVRQAPVLRGCHGCAKRELCRPCVAMLEAEAGDVNGKAPYLCTMADCLYTLVCQERETKSRGEVKPVEVTDDE